MTGEQDEDNGKRRPEGVRDNGKVQYSLPVQ